MAKKSAAARCEEPADDELSSGDFQVYKPGTGNDDLEVDERAYLTLEHLPLEWPAQSIAVLGTQIFLGTNPAEGNDNTELIKIDIKSGDYSNLKYKDRKINRFINRIRIGKEICAVSDKHLTIYNEELKMLKEVSGEFSYGLCATPNEIFVGTQDGRLQIFSWELVLVRELKLHTKAIESIAVDSGLIYTGSSDHTLKISNIDGTVVRVIENDSDVNALDVRAGKLVFGDDKGAIKIIHLEEFREEEPIIWHVTPISMVRWKDDDIFASASAEQVCIWDTSLVDEWDYHKYLLFVHQGQRDYKDIDFNEDNVITTAEDGLCIFKPTSFKVISPSSADESGSSESES